jgi:hypothetical protein
MRHRSPLSRRQLLVSGGVGGLLFLTQTPSSAGSDKEACTPLYLHWCTPTYYFSDKRTNPPSRILSTRVVLGEDISITLGKDSTSLTGRVELRDKKYFADLKGSYGPMTGIFEGPIELEKRFEPGSYVGSSIILSTYFVLSTSPKCEQFLKAETADPIKQDK